MAHCMFWDKPVLESMPIYCQSALWGHNSVISNQIQVFIRENEFENDRYKMSSTLFRAQFVRCTTARSLLIYVSLQSVYPPASAAPPPQYVTLVKSAITWTAPAASVGRWTIRFFTEPTEYFDYIDIIDNIKLFHNFNTVCMDIIWLEISISLQYVWQIRHNRVPKSSVQFLTNYDLSVQQMQLKCHEQSYRRIILLHWTGNVTIVMTFSSLAALEVVILTTSNAASNENVVKMRTICFSVCTVFQRVTCHVLIAPALLPAPTAPMATTSTWTPAQVRGCAQSPVSI